MVEGLLARRGDRDEGESHVVLEMLLEVMGSERDSAHNYALLMLWASQANAVPVSSQCSSPSLIRPPVIWFP